MAQEIPSPNDLIVEYLNNLEKKQRNLMKRKTKLEVYRDMIQRGETLTNEQNKAVGDYQNVLHSIIAMKEVAEGLCELQLKVESVVKESEKHLTEKHEEFALNALQNLVPVYEILSKISSPLVKAAITKASSPQQCKTLEVASKLISIQIPPGTESAELNNDIFKEPSSNMFKFATCASVSIQPSKGNKSRFPTFADVKQTCVDMLADPNVRRALSAPYAESALLKKKSSARSEVPKIPEPAPVVELQTLGVEPVVEVLQPKVPEQVTSNFVTTMPVESILDSVINPLKTNFNFLQASHVDAAPVWQVQMEQAMQQANSGHSHVMPNSMHQNQIHPSQQSNPPPSQPTRPLHLEQLQRQHDEQPPVQPNTFVDVTVQHPIEHQERPQPTYPELSVDNKPQERNLQEPHHQNGKCQVLEKQQTETKIQEPPKPIEKLSESSTSKKKRNKREKATPTVTQSQQHQTEPTSLQAVMDEEILLENKPSQKLKSWADLCGGGTCSPIIPELQKPTVINTIEQHHKIETHEGQHPSVQGREDINRQPRGGFRGGRGRGSGQPFRGGRGRAAPRGSFQNAHNRNSLNNERQAPIQSTC